jgi:hypothetical protein
MVGCNLKHCSKRYLKSLQKVWEEWKVVQTEDFSNGKSYANILMWAFSSISRPKTLDEEKNRRNTDGAGLSSTKVAKQPRDLIGGKDSLKREATE